MLYDKKLVDNSLRLWEEQLKTFSLPTWEGLPSIDLYMDQVIVLLTQYLDFLPHDQSDDKVITSSIINNYVRMKVMPPPVKKKYSRTHLAYLIIICTLKQSLNISYIQRILPLGLSEEEVHELYNRFINQHKGVSLYFIEQINSATQPILNCDDTVDISISNLVITSAIASNLYKFFTENLIMLQSQKESEDIKVKSDISKK